MTVDELRTLLADLPGYYRVVVEDVDDPDVVHDAIVGVQLRYTDAAIQVVLPYAGPELGEIILAPIVESDTR